jgi:hypothetical protein
MKFNEVNAKAIKNISRVACGREPRPMYGLALTVNPRMCEQRIPVVSMYQAFASKPA